MIQKLCGWRDSPWKMLKMYTKAIGFHTALSFTWIDRAHRSPTTRQTQPSLDAHLMSGRRGSRLVPCPRCWPPGGVWRLAPRLHAGTPRGLAGMGRAAPLAASQHSTPPIARHKGKTFIHLFLGTLKFFPPRREGTAPPEGTSASFARLPAYLREGESPSPVGTVVNQGPTDRCDYTPRVP